MKTVISQDELQEFLQGIFGTKVKIADQKIANQQHDYLVLIVQLRSPSMHLVVKLAGPEAWMAASFERTAMFHHLVAANASTPMPEILAVNTSYQTWPWRYMIKTFIPGQEWAIVRQQMNDAQLANAYHQIGSAVAKLHAIRFPTFGEPGIDGIVPGSDSYLTSLIERVRCSISSPHLRDLFYSVLEKRKFLFLDVLQASLCHEDLHGHNLIFQFHQNRWRLAAILDFDKAWSGHNEIDLARMEFWKGMTSKDFWVAYKAIHPIEPLYEQRRPIYQLQWCFEYARMTPEHLADTRLLCAELGLPELENFQ